MHARSLGPLVKTRPFGMTPSQKDRKLHRYDGACHTLQADSHRLNFPCFHFPRFGRRTPFLPGLRNATPIPSESQPKTSVLKKEP
jgi:hypothetical protein